ncbi:protein of unknown function [Candidatus Bipolaricaulis anaerobius]|uniref:Uncharacterized protein n=1 Tax=Candidatus Bipolaricaulis anaerobius TaxID=2026885 RepID=A0A2X3L0X0_9BACT|nr:protein of unknown function [Candidatus Bipolaricaulis anaerobius]
MRECRLLFDTGSDRLVLAHNSQAMDVDLAPITDIFTMPLATTSAGSPTC